jgi:exodeoxyribonuclease-3
VCLQEIKAESSQIPGLLLGLDGYWCCWHGGKGYSGVGLHVSNSVSATQPAFVHPAFDYEHRIAAAEIAGVTVASIYVPNGGKDLAAKMRFLEALEGYARSFQESGRPLILCGDLNVARTDMDVHVKERKPQAVGQLPEERALFERILACDLVDVGRAADPANDGLFTWWAPWRNLRARNIGWRIDYVLATTALARTVTSCLVAADVGTSDHAPVVATFGTPALEPKP